MLSNCLANTDDELDGEEEEQPQATRRSQIAFGKLRTADTTGVKQVLWPHELVFTPEGRHAVYESMSSMAFANGYLSIMSLQMDTHRDKMAIHLQEMMEDWETFGWPVVRAYHTPWLQHLEQGRATWGDEVTRLKLPRVLVWHRIASPTKPQPSAAQSTNQPTTHT